MEIKDFNKEFTCFPVKLEDAQSATENWRNWMSDNNVQETVHTNAFFIPIGDLVALISMLQNNYPNMIGVRAYVGMGDPPENGGSALKLLLVGVNPSALTITPDPGVDIIANIGESGLVTVYDFTSPCPKFCDADSSLMKNK